MKKNIRKRITIVFISILILTFLIIGLIYLFNNKPLSEEEMYVKKMDMYSYSLLYENDTSTPDELVTKKEALMVLFGTTYNITNIESTLQSYMDKFKSLDKSLLYYLYDNKIITSEEINLDNLNENINRIDIIKYLYRMRTKFSKVDDSLNNYSIKELQISDIDNYSGEELEAIKSLVLGQVLENNGNIDGFSIANKAFLNKLVIENVLKLGIVAPSSTDSIVLDESKYPKNSEMYPYIIEGVDNKVYEQDFAVSIQRNFQTPADYYKKRHDYYKSIQRDCEKYYNMLLNIDYKTIDSEEMINSLYDMTIGILDTSEVEEYVRYVVKNEIILKGVATVQQPVIYNDGESVRVRTKLEFEVVNSKTNENLLFLDLQNNQNIIYDKDNYVIYIDASMSNTLSSMNLSSNRKCIYELLLPMSQKDLKLSTKSTDGDANE